MNYRKIIKKLAFLGNNNHNTLKKCHKNFKKSLLMIVYIKCINDFDSIGQIAIKIIDTTDDKYKTD